MELSIGDSEVSIWAKNSRGTKTLSLSLPLSLSLSLSLTLSLSLSLQDKGVDSTIAGLLSL